MSDTLAPASNTIDEAAERSLRADLRQLAEDARALAEAEVAYQKSRALFAGQEAKRIAVFGIGAAVFAFFALMALTVGLVIALTPLLTAWGATAVVFGVLLAIALLCARMALKRWRFMGTTLYEEDATP